MENRRALYSFSLSLFLLAGAEGEVYQVNRQAQWQEWQFPAGTLELKPDGSVAPVEFEQPINAALNAAQFAHDAKGGKVQGGVRKAGSGLAAARSITDGNPDTFWKPESNDPLEDWWVEIDLGRAVPVTRVRLLFPDQEGARPFREFRVFGADGKRVQTGEDIFSFNLIGGTTRPNDQLAVEYPLKYLVADATLVIGNAAEAGAEAAEVAENPLKAPYTLLQYIRFRADARSPDAALAEVEVYAFGENISLGTLERGGSIVEQSGRGSAMADGDVNTVWGVNISSFGAAGEDSQVRWEWDLGAIFWVRQVVMFAQQLFTTRYSPNIQNHRLLGSDGRRKLTGEVDYENLFDFHLTADQPVQLRYLFLSPRPIRYLSGIYEEGLSGDVTEIGIFPIGYVAQVEMASDFIDLGEFAGDQRPKAIRSLSWEADLPVGTSVQLRTRSGNTLVERIHYFHRDGRELSETEYNKLVKALRGEKPAIIEPGDDWSEWSNFYQLPGQGFLSPSPRRYVQIRLLLASELPTAAPTLRSLSIDFTDALLAGIAGEVQPRTALPGVVQDFSYRFIPQFREGDMGFNRLLLETPSAADPTSVSVRLGGQAVEPAAVRIAPDSLMVALPRVVRREEVEVDFRLVVLQNATLLQAAVGHTRQLGLWQAVDPVEHLATTVFLPTVPQTRQLVANLSIAPAVLTPNGDGLGEQTEIRFSILKVETPAQVQIYTLSGELVGELAGQLGPDGVWRYLWSGRDREGALVPPGNYLCRIELETQAGGETSVRVIGVVY